MGSLELKPIIVFGSPQINIKLIMAKTKEMLSKRYLKKDLAYQLQTWFVDWSWDPSKPIVFGSPQINTKLIMA